MNPNFRTFEEAEREFIPKTDLQRRLHYAFWGRSLEGRSLSGTWTRPAGWVEELVYSIVPDLQAAAPDAARPPSPTEGLEQSS